MASFHDRVPQNSPGKFYVDGTCIYCELCVKTAPATFRESNEMGWAFVFAQPRDKLEQDAALLAADGCPTESIGFDGDTNDWAKPGLDPLNWTTGV